MPQPFLISRNAQPRQRLPISKNPVLRLSIFFICLIFAGGGWQRQLYAAPEAELWPRWQAHDPESQALIEHQDWDLFLNRYLDTEDPSGIHRMNYLAVTEQDKILLNTYIVIQKTDRSLEF